MAAHRAIAAALGKMICQLCGRPLGVKTEAHHLTPKTFGGRETIPLHPICHRKIHTTFTERELRRDFHTVEALWAHDEIRRFIAWIASKHPDFYVATHDAKTRGIGRAG
jgi:hypothetical protein